MKVFLQRVAEASVTVDEKPVAAISRGLLLLSGIAVDDTEAVLRPMAEKIVNLRIFPDERGKFHYSLADIKGELLLVPQFTLFADSSKGRRPEFFGAMRPPRADELFSAFAGEFLTLSVSKVECGVFGAHMMVRLANDGPVSFMLES